MSISKRQKDVNPYNHIRQKSNDDWYLYWACEDKELQDEMSDYNEFHAERFDRDLTDEEIQLSENMMSSMKQKFDLSQDEFDFIQASLHWQIPLDFPFKILGHDNLENLIIKIPQDIKKSDYIGAWGDLLDYLHPRVSPERELKKKHRIRAADDTLLVYAIHKSRLKGLSFNEIFKQYQYGTLNSYTNKPTNQFQSEDSLERYYRKYRPAR